MRGGYTTQLKESHFLRTEIYRSSQAVLRMRGAPAAEELRKVNTTITKSSQGSCALCLARFAAALDRIGGSSDPCSPQFRESQPCYHTGNSSLAHWKLWQHSSPAQWSTKANQLFKFFLQGCFPIWCSNARNWREIQCARSCVKELWENY